MNFSPDRCTEIIENRQIPNSSTKDVLTLLTPSQLVQMELQLQRQQAQAQRQTLDRLARRPPATSAPAQVVCNRLTYLVFKMRSQAQPSTVTPATSSSSGAVKSAEATSPPTPSNFLLDELTEEEEEGMREGVDERPLFIGELLLGALSIQSEDQS